MENTDNNPQYEFAKKKVNVIVTCPKAFRCYEPASGKMYYENELIEMGIALSPTGKLVHVPTAVAVESMFALWNTSQQDDTGQALYEGDICDIAVDTGMGLVARVAIMRWSPEYNNFSLHFNGRSTFKGGVTIKSCKKIGNEFQDLDAGLRYKHDNE